MNPELALLLKLALDLGALRDAGPQIKSALDPVSTIVENVSGAIQKNFASAMADVGAAASTLGSSINSLSQAVSGFIGESLKMSGSMEQNRIAFTTMLGSAEHAKQLLGQLSDFAAKTPFELPGLIKASQRLMAFGFEADKLIPMLRTIGDAAAGMNTGAEGVARITDALGKMSANARVSAEEMNMLTDAGIKAWHILADGMGKSVAEVRKLSEKGMIDSAKAIEILLKGMGDKFNGMMDAQSKTLLGRWSNIKDDMGRILVSIGDALAPIASKALDAMGPLLDAAKLAVAAFKQLPEPMQAAVIVMAGLTAAAGPALLAFGGFAASIAAISAALPVLMGPLALGGLSVALPIIASAALLAGGAFAAWKLDEITGSGSKLQKVLVELTESLGMSGLSVALQSASKESFSFANMLDKATDQILRSLPGVGDVVLLLTNKIAGGLDQARIKMAAVANEAHAMAALGSILEPAIRAQEDMERKRAEAAERARLAAAKAAEEAKRLAKEFEHAMKAMGEAVKRDWRSMSDLVGEFPRTLSDAFNKGFNIEAGLKAVTERISDLKIKLSGLPEAWAKYGKAGDDALKKEAASIKGQLVNLDFVKQRLEALLVEQRKLAEEKHWAKTTEEVNKVNQKLLENKDRIADIIALEHQWVDVDGKVHDSVKGVGDEIRKNDAAAKLLGVTFSTNLVEKAHLLKAAYEQLSEKFGGMKEHAMMLQEAKIKWMEAEFEGARKSGEATKEMAIAIENQKKALDNMAPSLIKHRREVDDWTKQWQEFGREGRKILDDFSGSLASVAMGNKDLGKAVTAMWQDIKHAFVKNIMEGMLKQAIKGLLDLEGGFTSLAQSVTKMFGGLGNMFGGIGSGIGGAASGAGGAAGSAGGAASGGLGAAMGGLTGIIGAVGSIGTMISSIVGNFQTARMEKDIGRMEVTMREIKAEVMNARKDAWDQFGQIFTRIGEQHNAMYERLGEVWSTLQNGIGVNMQGLNEGFTSFGEFFTDAVGTLVDLGVEGNRATDMIANVMDQGFRAMSGGGAGSSIGRALEQMGDYIKQAMLITVEQQGRFYETNVRQMQLVVEGVWATYQAVSKPGWQTSLPTGVTGNGSSRTAGAGTSGTGNTYQINVQQQASPFSTGIGIAQGIRAVTGAR